MDCRRQINRKVDYDGRDGHYAWKRRWDVKLNVHPCQTVLVYRANYTMENERKLKEIDKLKSTLLSYNVKEMKCV